MAVISFTIGCSASVHAGAGAKPKQPTAEAAAPAAGACQATAISAGAFHGCAVVSGTAKCWGNNSSGQIGRGDAGSQAPVSEVVLPSAATAIAAGGVNSCVAHGAGEVRCWGHAMMFGSEVDQRSPTAVNGLKGVKSIGVGTMSACALMGSGGVKCWGVPSVAMSRTPADVEGLVTGVSEISLHAKQLCAIVKGGAKCGTPSVVKPVIGLTAGVTSIAAGQAHACAVVNGGVKCWEPMPLVSWAMVRKRAQTFQSTLKASSPAFGPCSLAKKRPVR